MYPEIYNRCIEVILSNEGGYQCNPNDLGNWSNGVLKGTKYGICARFYQTIDIKNLTPELAKAIYFKDYWLKMNLTGIVDANVILQLFDMGVNAGRSNSIRMAQRVAGVKADGVCGNVTKQAINDYERIEVTEDRHIVHTFINDFKQARIDYYRRIAERGNNKVFLNGWIDRVYKTRF